MKKKKKEKKKQETTKKISGNMFRRWPNLLKLYSVFHIYLLVVRCQEAT